MGRPEATPLNGRGARGDADERASGRRGEVDDGVCGVARRPVAWRVAAASAATATARAAAADSAAAAACASADSASAAAARADDRSVCGEPLSGIVAAEWS